MKIAVLSGKGGTGKTTVSASMAASLENCQYIDCDVEEPNGAIFLKPDITDTIKVDVKVPQVNKEKCTECGKCADACQFNAIALVKGKILIFSELCHHCGACSIACPHDAIDEVDRSIGIIEKNRDATFMHGKLDVGEPISIPIIQRLKSMVKSDMPVVLDCPPGASCAVVEAVEECDFCLLVTEPTPFGLHDLEIAVKLVRKMDIPFGVVLNKASNDSTIIHDFCRDNNIAIMLEIPYSKDIARAYSEGRLPVYENSGWKEKFCKLFEEAKRSVKV